MQILTELLWNDCGFKILGSKGAAGVIYFGGRSGHGSGSSFGGGKGVPVEDLKEVLVGVLLWRTGGLAAGLWRRRASFEGSEEIDSQFALGLKGVPPPVRILRTRLLLYAAALSKLASISFRSPFEGQPVSVTTISMSSNCNADIAAKTASIWASKKLR